MVSGEEPAEVVPGSPEVLHSEVTDLDAGASESGVSYSSPDPAPEDALEAGDVLTNELGNPGPYALGVDGGLAPDAGTQVGSYDADYGYASACLHVDTASGSYRVIPDSETPEVRFQAVLQFAHIDGTVRVLGFQPWSVGSVEVVDGEQVVTVTRQGTQLEVRYLVGDASVAVLSVLVLAT